MVRSASCASRTMRPRFPLQPSFETRANARSSEPDRKCIQHFQALSNHLKMILVFVMARQKREARLRARCPGHPRLSCLSAAKTWMPGTRPGMTSFARLEALFHWLHFRSGSQDDGLFFGALFLDFFAVFFFLGTWLHVAAFFAATFAVLRAFGRFFTAARWAAASAARAQPVNSSGSAKSRAGNCQYEFTMTVLARVWY